MWTKLKIKYGDTPFVTNILLTILFVIFILEEMMGGSQNSATLLNFGAQYNPLIVVDQQWWRLFTAQFLHIGVLHIASNAVIVYYMGNYMERLLGHWRFLLVYLLSGVGGSLLSLGFGSDNAISAGASTALFGLFGAMIVMGILNCDQAQIRSLGVQSFALAIVNLALDLFMTDVDILGHFGGLITGCLLTMLLGTFKSQYWRTTKTKTKIIALVILIIYATYTIHIGLVITT